MTTKRLMPGLTPEIPKNQKYVLRAARQRLVERTQFWSKVNWSGIKDRLQEGKTKSR